MLRRWVVAVTTVALLALVVADASAAAQRTFVASYGLAANTAFNCSIVKPCRAFGEAIGVTSPGGEVIVLDSAGYGIVTISQSVSIIAPSGVYAGVSVFAGTDGITVSAPGATIALRGLSITGQGGSTGIWFNAGDRLRVENCVVSGMTLDGIYHSATGGEMIVVDSTVRDNGRTGIDIYGDGPSVVLDHVRSEHNKVDGFYIAPTAGSPGALATIVDSVFTHNGWNGIWADAPTSSTLTIVVERSTMSSNGKDGFLLTSPAASGRPLLSRNVINDNGGNGIRLQGRYVGTLVENHVHRNSSTGVRLEGDDFVALLGASTIAANLSNGLVCSSSGAGFLASLGNNLVNGGFSNVGCSVSSGGF